MLHAAVNRVNQGYNYGQTTAEAVEDIYRPLLRFYFGAFAVYYWVMLPTHLVFFAGYERAVMASLAFLAAALGTLASWLLRKPVRIAKVEALCLVFNGLIIANITMALNLGFDSAKLVYFVIAAMAFSLVSASLRQALSSLILTGFSFVSFAPRLDPATLFTFAFLAIGAAIASLSIAVLLRRSIVSIAYSRIKTERKLAAARELEDELRIQSLSDSLTGLPNRRAFFRALGEVAASTSQPEMQADAGTQSAAWLLLIDLDGFKAVNDVHGHQAGDKLLRDVASRLQAAAGENAHISRMGGDEFHLLLEVEGGADAIGGRCEKILTLLSQPYYIDRRLIRISGSIGCKKLDTNRDVKAQIIQADFALMVAKREGKNRFVIFTSDHAREVEERFTVENALRNGDLANEISLVFQPQFELGSNKITGAEALARWSNPKIGQMQPERFIGIAESSGLIADLTLIIVKKALFELETFPPDLRVSINLSCHDLISSSTIDQIIALTSEVEIDPVRIEFEVTETAMMADFDKANLNLNRLREVGFSIALDDFGTGYSNFSYLRQLPINKLKVDRSFLEDPSDPMTEKMLASLVGMARILEVHCLLEGIEDELGLLIAKRVGAQSVQGFMFGRPMQPDKFREFADRQRQEIANDTGNDTADDTANDARRNQAG